MAAWDDVSAAGGLGECAVLVRSAEALRFSAPELAVQLARRALASGAVESAVAGGTGELDQARALSMRAHAVLAGGLVRVSRYVDAVEPAFAALALADGGGMIELATSVRLDLAACAREVGEPLLGCAVLRPVLETAQPRSSVRAMALGRLVGCIAHVGRRDDVEDALAEAGRLVASDDSLSPDARRVEHARLSMRAAAYHRWYGDTEDAVNAAREGIGQLSRLRSRRPEVDRLRAQLVLELVCSLLDEGEFGEAESASTALLAEPVRATSAAAIGQLMLAVSTRIHLPSGRVERGRGLLDQAVWVAERHGLDGMLADVLTVVCQLDERAGRSGDALESLRAARSAEQRRLRATARAARQILVVVGSSADWDVEAASALLRQVARQHVHPVAAVPSPPQPATAERDTETDAATGLPNREGLFRRLRSVRNGERPVALTLVRVSENGTRSGINLTELAGRVRDLAPDDAELARSDGTELAVLLPHTTLDQAERFAQALRETAIESDWLSPANARSISTGVGQSNPDSSSVDARALLTTARHAMVPAQPARQPGERTQPVRSTALTAEELTDLQDVGDTLRIGRSIISSLSIPSGSGGKRRAETGTHPKLPPDPGASSQNAPQPTPHYPPNTPNSGPQPSATGLPSNPAPAESAYPATDPEPTPPGQRSVAAREPARPVGETGGYRPLASFQQNDEQQVTDSATRAATEASDHAPVETGRPGGHTSSYEQTRAELARLMSALESGSVPDTTPPSTAQSNPDPRPQVGMTNELSIRSASPPAGAASGANEQPQQGSSSHNDSGARPTSSAPASSPKSVPDSATVDDGGALGVTSTVGESGLRWSFGAGDSAALPAPAEPRGVMSTPSQSIPTPPEPSEVPEPPHRPEIPEPPDPDPIPVPPPGPGPVPPDEPNPEPPGSTGQSVAKPPNSTKQDVAVPAGVAEPGSARQGVAGSSGSTGQGVAEPGSARQGVAALSGPTGRGVAESPGPAEQGLVESTGPAGQGATASSGSVGQGVAEVPSSAGQGVAESSGSAEPNTTPGSAGQSAAARRERRAERSSGSTTIAGLLAEALVAYQETTRDDEDTHGDRWGTRDNTHTNSPDPLAARWGTSTGAHDTHTDPSDDPGSPRSDQRGGRHNAPSDTRVESRHTRTTSSVALDSNTDPGNHTYNHLRDDTGTDPRTSTRDDAGTDPRNDMFDMGTGWAKDRRDVRTNLPTSTRDHERTSTHDDAGADSRGYMRASMRNDAGADPRGYTRAFTHDHSGIDPRDHAGTHHDTRDLSADSGDYVRDDIGADLRFSTRDDDRAYPHTSTRDDPPADSRGDSETSLGSSLGDGFGSFDRLFDWGYGTPASGRHRSPE